MRDTRLSDYPEAARPRMHPIIFFGVIGLIISGLRILSDFKKQGKLGTDFNNFIGCLKTQQCAELKADFQFLQEEA